MVDSKHTRINLARSNNSHEDIQIYSLHDPSLGEAVPDLSNDPSIRTGGFGLIATGYKTTTRSIDKQTVRKSRNDNMAMSFTKISE